MKRMIRTVPLLHLSDILNRIDHIIICENVDNYHKVTASETIEDDEMTDDEFYLTLSDSNLLELSADKLSKISNIELLGRIAKLDINKLNLHQRELLREAYRRKVVVDKQDVEELINRLKSCNSISYERRHSKTNEFLLDSNGRLPESECLSIIHQLTTSDYVATTRSYNPNHIGNYLFIFEPDCSWQTEDGTILEDITLYIKLDIDETTHNAVALVSMHVADYFSKRPYKIQSE